jgi:hypothetical protein
VHSKRSGSFHGDVKKWSHCRTLYWNKVTDIKLTPSIRKSWNYSANKRRSLGRHSSLADQNHGVIISDDNSIQCWHGPSAIIMWKVMGNWLELEHMHVTEKLIIVSEPSFLKRLYRHLHVISTGFRDTGRDGQRNGYCEIQRLFHLKQTLFSACTEKSVQQKVLKTFS